MVVNFIPLSL